MLSRACVGIEVSVQLTLLVFHSTSLLCLLHDRPAARSRPAALRVPVAARSRPIPPRSRPMLPCHPVTPRAPIPQACCQDFGPAARISLCCQDFGTAARIPVPLPGFRPRFQDFIMLPGFQLALPGFRPPPPGFRYRCQDFGFISCWNSESPKQTVQNVCQPAARISALLTGFHYANSSWNSEGPPSGWNSESPNSSWNSVRPNSSWNWDFSEESDPKRGGGSGQENPHRAGRKK